MASFSQVATLVAAARSTLIAIGCIITKKLSLHLQHALNELSLIAGGMQDGKKWSDNYNGVQQLKPLLLFAEETLMKLPPMELRSKTQVVEQAIPPSGEGGWGGWGRRGSGDFMFGLIILSLYGGIHHGTHHHCVMRIMVGALGPSAIA